VYDLIDGRGWHSQFKRFTALPKANLGDSTPDSSDSRAGIIDSLPKSPVGSLPRGRIHTAFGPFVAQLDPLDIARFHAGAK
jgi:hypothetical protein